jgi:protein-S-isoprenylcysteine O-methyltransferase Ste14
MNSATISAGGSPGVVRSAAALAYAVTCYLVFLSTFLAFIGFVGGMLPAGDHTSMPWWQAALIDVGLVLGFGLQHSIMARPAFKRMGTRIVPESAERGTYVLAASVMLITLMFFWQPLPGVIWAVQGTAAVAFWAVFAFGWATVLFTTFLIDHCELFGLRQAWAYATGRTIPEPTFKTPNVYRIVRHPMQLGFIIAFWAAPIM